MSNQEHWSIDQYKEYQKNKGKRSKYGAVKTSVDGQTFDSKKEADYYCELVFNNDDTSEIIDTKGFKTKEYIAKKKVFEDKYNLKIKEV